MNDLKLARNKNFNRMVTVVSNRNNQENQDNSVINSLDSYIHNPDDILKTHYVHNSRGTGIRCIDDLITGFDSEQLVIISGRTGSRKTMLAINMFLNYAQRYSSVFFNMELPKNEFNSRILSVAQNRRIDLHNIEKSNLIVVHTKCGINAIISYLEKNPNTEYLFIDYIGFMVDPLNPQKWVEEVIIIRKLKELTTKYKMVIVLVTQLNKQYHGRARPDETCIAGSDEISRTADKIIIAYNWNKANLHKATHLTHQFMEIIIPKCRQGDGNIGHTFCLNDFSSPHPGLLEEYLLSIGIRS